MNLILGGHCRRASRYDSRGTGFKVALRAARQRVTSKIRGGSGVSHPLQPFRRRHEDHFSALHDSLPLGDGNLRFADPQLTTFLATVGHLTC